ncbi:S41 family peptidase [Desulfogranum marinum]|uniref:S41 family peptidase n=1 Tax=Desulfogranum marinum TaxID=453220 RepID=UPI001964A4F7|nr:S41 family peptidase [Desulfogranum marinum]MBM9514882.1 hypothetical protein [Desulfogranum marinum]
MALFQEAILKIRSEALLPSSPNRTVQEATRAYVQSIDEYGDYLTAKEYTAYKKSTTYKYSGISLELREKIDGRFFLYPLTENSLKNSGIKSGDELIAVNGFPVYGKSLFVIGTEIRGENKTWVQLTVKTGDNIPRIVSVQRKPTENNPLTEINTSKAYYVKIIRFTRDTPMLLRKSMLRVNKSQTIIFDLRHNTGGSLPAANQSADLFLMPGSRIYQLRTRNGVQNINSTSLPIADNPIIIIQDKETASAAEVFIAALVQNERATSAGKTTFGKGRAQRFFELHDGSALLLTYSEIIPPGEQGYHGKGLTPHFTLPDDLVNSDFRNIFRLNQLLRIVMPDSNNLKSEVRQ